MHQGKISVVGGHMTFHWAPRIFGGFLRDGTHSRPVTLRLRRQRSCVIGPVIALHEINFIVIFGHTLFHKPRTDYPTTKSWDYPILPTGSENRHPAALQLW